MVPTPRPKSAARRPTHPPAKHPSHPAPKAKVAAVKRAPARPAKGAPKPAPAKARSKPRAGSASAAAAPVEPPRSGDSRRHLLSLSFLRDGDEFLARLETDAGQITELKNRSLDQLLTLVAGELEDLLE